MSVIGISGLARSGKDTVGNYLVEVYGFKRIGFADSLKESCRHIFNFNDAQLYGELKEVVDPYWGFTPRFALQKVGTECMRNVFDKDIWIKSVANKVLSEPQTNWVLTDVRFENEAQAIKDWGGKLVKIERPLAGASGGIAQHPSETSLQNYTGWDYVLKNDINVHAVLYSKIEDMLSVLR